ncbi:hypothetical protein HYE60_11170 [Aggregatibacter actinomycetemcomitans]|uniref:hypothetical protein n=1 Tax=Aggregatibacter actinomycetemcomitans TaxID=714 RepID=UPI00197C97F2|nr:hypothetical protein [Aggregatibacter actinomycetemcomitans]MBN6075794.1 hypothetical protein [Aggregatibacter actinomycetemcomitans]
MRKEYTDPDIYKRNLDRHMKREEIKRSEYLMMWMYQLLTAETKFGTREAVLYRVKKRFTGDVTFDKAVEMMDKLITKAEKEELTQ